MKTSRRIVADTFDHRLETLEGRSLLSAAVVAPAADPAPATSNHQVAVADEAFLSAGSDASGDAASPAATNDADMYDFGGAWGSQAPAAAAQAAPSYVDLDNGAVDQSGDRPAWTITPSDVLAVNPPQWSAPAEYTPMPAEFGPQADSPATPSVAVSTPAPVADAPATPSEVIPADQTPVVIATGNAAAADTSFVWIENSDSWLLTTKAKASEQVVIESTFVQG